MEQASKMQNDLHLIRCVITKYSTFNKFKNTSIKGTS